MYCDTPKGNITLDPLGKHISNRKCVLPTGTLPQPHQEEIESDTQFQILNYKNNTVLFVLNIGARFTNDRKRFRDQLNVCLKKTNYKRVYLFLGSNDVLANDALFYR